MNLTSIKQQLDERGPDRVVIGPEGSATRPSRARDEFSTTPSVIFIRKDGWTLGAPSELERVAYELWAKDWLWYYRPGMECCRAIMFYQGSPDTPTRYRCPKCGGMDLHGEVSIVVRVEQDDPERNAYPEMIEFDGLGDGFEDSDVMLCDNEDCEYSAESTEFLVQEESSGSDSDNA